MRRKENLITQMIVGAWKRIGVGGISMRHERELIRRIILIPLIFQ